MKREIPHLMHSQTTKHFQSDNKKNKIMEELIQINKERNHKDGKVQ